MCREGHQRRQCCRLRKPKEHCVCVLLGAWRSSRRWAEPGWQHGFFSTAKKEEDEDGSALLPASLRLTSKPVPKGTFCQASSTHILRPLGLTASFPSFLCLCFGVLFQFLSLWLVLPERQRALVVSLECLLRIGAHPRCGPEGP